MVRPVRLYGTRNSKIRIRTKNAEIKKILVDINMSNSIFGYHLILDVSDMNSNISSVEKVEHWVRELVKRIDMVPFGEPRVERFGEGDLVGITAVQLIMTSSIVAHFTDLTGCGYIDVFSCKEFDQDDVIAWTHECFGGTINNEQFLIRG